MLINKLTQPNVNSSANEVQSLLRSGLLRLDVEFGNSFASFSASRDQQSLYGCYNDDAKSYKARIQNVELVIDDATTYDKLVATRSVSFKFSTPSQIYDLVSRYVVTDTSATRKAIINGQEINHSCSNIYYQYPADKVVVPIGTDGWIEFSGEQQGIPDCGFEHVFYIRDESVNQNGNRWIVHHRMIATTQAERLVLRGCHPHFNGPFPKWLNAILPSPLKHVLFRIREVSHPNFPIMVIGENQLPEGCKINLTTYLAYHV
jgi:hypothetical protein